MPDISMCRGTDCPLKDTCYRHTATPSEYVQAYFVNPPYDAEANFCTHHWPNTPVKLPTRRKDPQ